MTSTVIGAAFVVIGLMYLVAPIVVVRELGMRRSVDRETVLGSSPRPACSR